MREGILVVCTALISGMMASVVTILWQKHMERYNKKLNIFQTLMACRHKIDTEENVRALNSVDVFFYKDKNVREAYREFLSEMSQTSETAGADHRCIERISDKHLKLLEEMSRSLNLGNIHWDNIKKFYYPRKQPYS